MSKFIILFSDSNIMKSASKKSMNGSRDVNGNAKHENGKQKNGVNSNSGVTRTAVGHEVQQSVLVSILLPLFIIATTPNFILWIWYTVKFHDGSYFDFVSALFDSPNKLQFFVDVWSQTTIGSQFSLIVIGGYMLFQLLLMVVVPGARVEGPITENGNIPVYKDNGLRIFLITMLTFCGLTYYLKTYTPYSPSMVHDNFGDLLATMNAFALLFCVLLYLKGVLAPSTSDSGSTGNPVMDYYWGTELYPRIFGIDIKVSWDNVLIHSTLFW